MLFVLLLDVMNGRAKLMTREEALEFRAKWSSSAETIALINQIYDDFEKDLTIAVSEKTCDGCIHKPKANENYPEECGVCSRFYADEFEELIDEKRESNSFSNVRKN